MNRTRTRIVGAALIVIAIALGVVGGLPGKRPPLCQATAVVKVHRDQFDLPELSGMTNPAATTINPNHGYFLETEIVLIQSAAILGPVVTNLDLDQVWGKRLRGGDGLAPPEAVQLLRERIKVQPGPEVALITIQAASETAVEAADIANATARSYCDYRVEFRRRLAKTALAAVAGKHSEMEQQIAAAREKVDLLGRNLDPALRAQAATNSSRSDSEELRKLHTRLSDSILHYLTQSNQLALYQSKNPAGDEVVEQLKLKAEQAKAGMVAAETAAREAGRTQTLVKEYQAALFELDDLNQRFIPLQKTVAGLQQDLLAQGPAPALIVNPATPPANPVSPGAPGTNPWMLAGGGVALAWGVCLLWFGSKRQS